MNPLSLGNSSAPSPFTAASSSVTPFNASTTSPTAPQMSMYNPATAPVIPTPAGTSAPTGATGTFGGTADLPTQYSMVNGVQTPTGVTYQAPTKIDPQNYKVPVNTSVDSSVLGKSSPGALADALQAKQLALQNGTDPSLIPSDQNFMHSASRNPQQDLYGQVGALSQYSPEEQQLLQSKATNDAKIYNTQLAVRRQIKQLQEDGSITKEQAAGAISEQQRRADAQAADQAGLGSYLTSSLSVLGAIRGNQLTAAQNQYGMLQPTQVSPGSTLYNPVQGVQYQGTGAAPATIFSTAQQLWQTNPTFNTDGTPNYQPALDQANSYYQTHQMVNGGSGTQSSTSSGTNQSQQGSSISNFVGKPQADGTFVMPDGGAVNSVYADKISNNFPPQLQNYISTGPQGTAYINTEKTSKLPQGIQTQLAKAAAASGIPLLDSTASAGLQSVYSLYNNLDAMTSLVDKTLSRGPAGRLSNWTASKINDIFQNDPQLQNFNNLRTLAGQADTNLMGGVGSGFRQNTANLGLSIQNLPVPSDSYENAMVKINATRKLLDSAMSKTFPGFVGTGSITSTGSSTSAGSSTNNNPFSDANFYGTK